MRCDTCSPSRAQRLPPPGGVRVDCGCIQELRSGRRSQVGRHAICPCGHANVLRGAPAGRALARVHSSEHGRRDAWQAEAAVDHYSTSRLARATGDPNVCLHAHRGARFGPTTRGRADPHDEGVGLDTAHVGDFIDPMRR
jgi:hypothetical protein